MKSKFKTIMLFLLMVFLIGIIVIFGMAMYSDIMESDTTNIIVANTAGSIKEDDTTNNSNNSSKTIEIQADTQFFYNQLTEVQKSLYDGLMKNKENMMNGT